MSLRKDLVITRPGFSGALRKVGTYAHISGVSVSSIDEQVARVDYDYRDIETHEVFHSRSFSFKPGQNQTRSLKDQAYEYMMNNMDEFDGAEYSDDDPVHYIGRGMGDRVDRDV